MKSRFESHITLIELGMALLFFLLSSVTVLELFTAAYEQSMEAERLGRATALVQRCAERIAAEEAPIDALKQMGFERQADGAFAFVENGLTVRIEADEQDTLLSGRIEVRDSSGVLLEIPIARYYNKEVIRP